VLAVAGPGGASEPDSPGPSNALADSRTGAAPDIILISVDTLRADRLGSYGYRRPTDPNLARFARQAKRFTRATTTAAWTLPAHASLFTGLYPTEHGSQMIRREPGAKPKRALPLDPRFATLAEVLADAGYRTAGVAANFLYFKRIYHLDQGFQDWTVLPGKVGVSAAPASAVNIPAIDWLKARHAERATGETRAPFFLFLNYMDAHAPYNTRPVEGFPGPAVPPFTLAAHKRTQALVMGRDAAAPPFPRLEALSKQYDQGVANVDAGLGALFETLRGLDLFEDALIVVTSDHGEFLGEHRLVGHGKDVYEGTLHVPLFVKQPQQKTGADETRRISLVHVPRLILDAAGLTASAPKNAFPHAWPAATIFAQNRYSLWVDLKQPWGQRFDRIRQALYEDNAKFIYSSDGDHALFDLGRDPGEERNLLDDERRRLWLTRIEAERPMLDAAQPPAPEPAPLSTDEEDQLRALGYID
jgi:arylsulfatase A-like enzyme